MKSPSQLLTLLTERRDPLDGSSCGLRDARPAPVLSIRSGTSLTQPGVERLQKGNHVCPLLRTGQIELMGPGAAAVRAQQLVKRAPLERLGEGSTVCNS